MNRHNYRNAKGQFAKVPQARESLKQLAFFAAGMLATFGMMACCFVR